MFFLDNGVPLDDIYDKCMEMTKSDHTKQLLQKLKGIGGDDLWGNHTTNMGGEDDLHTSPEYWRGPRVYIQSQKEEINNNKTQAYLIYQ